MRKTLHIVRITLLTLFIAIFGALLLVNDVREAFIRFFQDRILKGGSPLIAGALLATLALMAGIIVLYLFGRTIILNITRLHGDTCPNCHRPLERVHRSTADQLACILLLSDLHRYGCTNPRCGWGGLRHH